MVRLDVQVRLKSHEKDLVDFGLPLMSETEKKTVVGLVNIEETVIREEMDYDLSSLRDTVQETYQQFTNDPREIFDKVRIIVYLMAFFV